MRAVGLLGMALLTLGCYDYRQIDSAARPSAGTVVRVELTDAGTTRAVPAIGPYALMVEGPVQNADQNGLTIMLQTVRRRGEGESKWNGETLTLASSDIRFVRERRTARGRTALALTAFVGGGAAILYAIARATGLVSGNSNRPPIPGT